MRVENTQEAIVSKELFDQVRQQIANRRRQQKNGEIQIFSGLLYCADCGWSMSSAAHNGSNPYRYYNCAKYRQYGKTAYSCTSHYIRYDELSLYVLERIRYWSSLIQADASAVFNTLIEMNNCIFVKDVKKKTALLEKAKKRKAELDRLFMKLYEDWAAERITEHNFTMLSQNYQTEQQAIEKKSGR